MDILGLLIKLVEYKLPLLSLGNATYAEETVYSCES